MAMMREIEKLVESGAHARAVTLIRENLGTGAGQATTALRIELIKILVTTSRHKEAIEAARDLEREECIGRLPRPLARLLVIFVGVAFFLSPRLPHMLARLARSRSPKVGWDALRSLQFAYFWTDIDHCVYLAWLQLGCATTREQELRSIAWLAYAAAYRRGGRIATNLLRRTIVSEGGESLKAELEPLLGIALLMGGRAREAQKIFDAYEIEHENAPSFYRQLIRTAYINCLAFLDELASLERAIDASFSYSFAMQQSRHQLQTYAARAYIDAVLGRRVQALEVLGKAKSACEANADNLDQIIYWRWHAEIHALLGEASEVRRAIEMARRPLASYGNPRFYVRLLARAERRVRGKDSRFDRRQMEFIRQMQGQRTPEKSSEAWSRLGERIATWIASDLYGDRVSGIGSIASRAVREIFEVDSVLVSNSYEELVKSLRGQATITSFLTFDEDADWFRAACDGGASLSLAERR